MKTLKFAWTFVNTFIGLLYVGLYSLLGWYRFDRRSGDALVWTPRRDKKLPKGIENYWSMWKGHTIGNVIVLANPIDDVILTHEKQHVHQYMILGPFFILVYLLGTLIAFLAGENSYRSNPLELAARRAAGQRTDV